MKLNLKLNLGDGYLYGDASTESSSYKINITQGYTESGNQIFLRGNLKNEDTDMIRLFVVMDTLIQLTEDLPTSMDVQDS